MAAPRRHSHTTDGTAIGTLASWTERLTELARLASTSTDIEHERDDMARSMNYHLDAIEGILCDPRPEITQELGRCRPNSGGLRRRSDSTEGGKKKGTELSERDTSQDSGIGDHWVAPKDDGIENDEILSQLKSLMKEATALKDQLRERHRESNEICELYEERCRGLQRTVAELELEVAELKADLAEDAVELEGVQGTIRGLQAWVNNLYVEKAAKRQERSIAQERAQRRLFSRGSRVEEGDDSEADMVLEGLGAWMRGWRDVEEGFQIRAQARKMRREQRQASIVREEISSKGLPQRAVASTMLDGADAGLWSRAFPAQPV